MVTLGNVLFLQMRIKINRFLHDCELSKIYITYALFRYELSDNKRMVTLIGLTLFIAVAWMPSM